ncbi:3-deoxy-D-manno-octulosonic acid transferase [Mangrovivirga sp. M17]|uniref:3-deoxy-D-manno-octulosonic acid transferase n=1 Tax=Mangrovivirga halotolerans TaxID=2993936 RepID=A0ABT3RM06_9BACT|nr:glycosyltransferase N-terminal domain-containing protein [Mangrovivirga halotolerans]MCX2742853.1 3-deoxy-D-manno-octulosonic acid transferase [Mangrovivirga halotolerans]
MNKTTYTIGINLYRFLIKLAAPFNKKAANMIEGRKNWRQKLKNSLNDVNQVKVWFHCASLGEFEQARPLIEKLSGKNVFIIVSFFSPSGYEVRKNYEKADLVTYLPFDTKSNASDFIDLIKPDLVLFTKYEFWHYFLEELNKQNIPTVLFSAIFRSSQEFFKPTGDFFRNMLKKFDFLYVQNEKSKELLNSIGLSENVEIAGDTRFDRVIDACNSVNKISLVETFKGEKKLLVVGSSWPEDIKALLKFFRSLPEDVKVIIAPHEISEKSIEKLKKSLPHNAIRYSEASENKIESTESDFLIIDNYGMLSSVYQYGDISFIGGAFKDGLHNILEAATFGMPVIFGNKNYKKFNEAVLLIDEGGAYPVADSDETDALLKKLFNDNKERERISNISYDFVRKNKGATDQILKYVEKILYSGHD